MQHAGGTDMRVMDGVGSSPFSREVREIFYGGFRKGADGALDCNKHDVVEPLI